MNDLQSLFGDLGGFADELKDLSLMAAGAVGARVAYGFIGNKANSMLTKADGTAMLGQYQKAALYGVEIAAGVLAAKHLRALNPAIAHGAAIGLVADGIVGLLTTFVPGTFGAGQMLSVGQGSLGALPTNPGFKRYLQGSPTTVEKMRGLGASPVTAERVRGLGSYSGMGNTKMAATLV
jgi:hypothetical protein